MLKKIYPQCNFSGTRTQFWVRVPEAIVGYPTTRDTRPSPSFSVTYESNEIKGQQSVKYLGVVIDQGLSGDTMANSVISKTLGKLKFVYRYKSYLDQTLRKNLCMALLQCHLDYCSTTWYPTLSSKLKNKLQTTQNKIVRYILNFNHREHVGQTRLDSLKFLNVSDRVEQLRLNHVFKIRQGLSPVYLSEGFIQLSNSHRFQTRSSTANFFVHRSKMHFMLLVSKTGIAFLPKSKALPTTTGSNVKLSAF